MNERGNHIIRLVMLVSGIILLLTVVIPHHHHANGLPCIHLFEHADDNDAGGDTHHRTCDCVGHDMVFNSKILHDSGDDTVYLPLLPLFKVMDNSLLSPELLATTTAFRTDKTLYSEQLHSTWVAQATGLRAPPFSLFS